MKFKIKIFTFCLKKYSIKHIIIIIHIYVFLL